MSKCIAAHTNPGSDYPGYINFTREDDGTITVHFRGDPSKVEGAYVCGYAFDRGSPGRCTPGDERCNNYCNMAPEKGPMQKHPSDCSHIREGNTATLKLSAADFAALIAETWKTSRERS
jgi:hypothetical protein